MKFDKLINIVLKESDDSDITPALDGQPEIYATHLSAYYTDEDGDWGGNKKFTFSRVARATEQEWNSYDFENVHQGNSYSDAYEELLNVMSKEGLRGKNFLLQVDKFKNLTGVFKVSYFDDGDSPPTLFFACKIDTATARSKQINKDLKDADTTGLEDIL
jgi:hypothetical protein